MTEEKRNIYPKMQVAANGGDTAVIVGAKSFIVTPSDTENLSILGCSLHLSKSGNIRLTLMNDEDGIDNSILWEALPGYQPLAVKKVWATDTDNTIQIIALC